MYGKCITFLYKAVKIFVLAFKNVYDTFQQVATFAQATLIVIRTPTACSSLFLTATNVAAKPVTKATVLTANDADVTKAEAVTSTRVVHLVIR